MPDFDKSIGQCMEQKTPDELNRLDSGLLDLFGIVFVTCLFSFPDYASAWSDDPTVNTPICTATNDQESPKITSDGAGGAIITWEDHRVGSNSDIYAQRVDASGTPLWFGDGVAICGASGVQLNPVITSDGSGGAIIAWEDYRNSSYDIYAQRVNAYVGNQWPTNGEAICMATNGQYSPTITTDGAGGAIIAWYDTRNEGLNYDIYAQRVDASGSPWWSANGVAICTAGFDQREPTLVDNGSEGAIITWEDKRNIIYSDIYAQRIYSNGKLSEDFPWILFYPAILKKQ
jgi:hypothetical protein